MNRPFVLGLTGSIGMGKSTVAGMFESFGVPVFDADKVVRQLQGPNGTLLPAIEAQFPGTTGPDGVNRAALGRLVFGDAVALGKLEAIVHPAVGAARKEFMIEHGGAKLVVFDIPLLFEKGGVSEVDAVAVVTAGPHTQRARVLARPGMTAERFAEILELQMPDSEKRRRADHIIDTDCPLARTREEVKRLIDAIAQHD